jgi:hypothetical protein
VKKLVPPPKDQPVNPFKFAGRIAFALVLALTLIIGPSQITAAAPELNSEPVKAHHHHNNQTNADHHSTDSTESNGHTAAIKIYCITATPGHANHIQHGDDICEGSRVMSSALTSGAFYIGRYFIVVGAEFGSAKLPTGRSPERLTEPPRTA